MLASHPAMHDDDFDPHYDDDFGNDTPPGYGADGVWYDPAGYDLDDVSAALVIEDRAVVVVNDDEPPTWNPDPVRNLRIGLPGGRSWKVKVNWPLVRRLGVTYGPAAATAAATAAGVPLPVAAVVGQVVAETLKTEGK